MPDCNVSLTNCSNKVIAKQLRITAIKFDAWHPVRVALLWFLFGMIFVASLDYGDVHICVGACDDATSKVRIGGSDG